MREHREPDGHERGRENELLVPESAFLQDEEGEDDRRSPARTEPAEKCHRRPARSGAEHGNCDRKHAHDGQAEDGVERNLPREVVQCGTEEDCSEDDERHGREDGAGLLRELGDIAAAMSSQAAEDRTADERGDEPGASDRLGQRESEQRSGQRNDLEPRLVDEAPAAGVTTIAAAAAPATTPPSTPYPIFSATSWTAWPLPIAPSSASATASAMRNSGTQIPSLRPLSTLRL